MSSLKLMPWLLRPSSDSNPLKLTPFRNVKKTVKDIRRIGVFVKYLFEPYFEFNIHWTIYDQILSLHFVLKNYYSMIV